MENICRQYMKENHIRLRDYWCNCGNLASQVVEWASKKGIKAKEIMIARSTERDLVPRVCIGSRRNIVCWSFHVVVEVNGMVHDPWYPQILSRDQYLKDNFGHHSDVKAWEK